jgi:hypothetical protein
VKGVDECGLYKLLENPMRHGDLVEYNESLCDLWCKHLGHFHYGYLLVLKDMVVEIPNFKVERTRVSK